MNCRLLGHNDLNGHGDSCQIMLKDGYAFVAHMESMGFSVVDVSSPENPRVVTQLPTPKNTHSHKLQLVGDILLVNRELLGPAEPGVGGVDIYDVSNPPEPKLLSHFPVGGNGVHRMWFVDGKYAHISAGGEGYTGQFYMVVDVSDPFNPREVSRWWLPGMWAAGGEQPAWRPGEVFFLHHFIVAGDRAYGGWWDAGVVILDISDIAHPRLVSQIDWSPPYGGNTHTALPLPNRGLVIVTDEALAEYCQEGQKMAWAVDIRVETNPVPIATFPIPEGDFPTRGGRFGPHNVHENRPGSLFSDEVIFMTYFNAGMRVFDIANPYRPTEIAFYVPPTPPGQKAIQMNDIYVTPSGLVYLTDRFNGGLYILQYEGEV